MAKIFYTLEEAAQRLGKAESEVRAMSESGQLQEFRDRDRLMFKVEQVDLLAGGEADDSISLADDLEPISLASSGSSMGMMDESDGTGVSIFDADQIEDADPSAQTVISDTASMVPDLGAIDPAASGSGLMDLTREADDTSLGEDLLQDVYGETGLEDSAAGVAPGADLFESTGAQSDVATQAPAMVMAVAETIEGGASGFAGGAALGMIIVASMGLGVLIMALVGVATGATADQATGGLLTTITDTLEPMAMGGALLGLIVVLGIVGWVIGKKN